MNPQNPPLSPRHGKRAILALIAALVLTAVVYRPGLNGPLLFDDGPNLEPLNAWLGGQVGWMSIVFENDSGLLGRPLSMASFIANIALAGPDPWGMKLVNLLIHLLNGMLVYALFAGLLRRGALARSTNPDSRWWACLGAAIWLLHPMFASTVLYVVQRMAMLSALFTLLTLLCYVRGREAWIAANRPKAFLWLCIGVPTCTLLAMFSKENGVLAPALCGIIELLVFCPAGGQQRSGVSKAFIGAVLLVPAGAAVLLTLAHWPTITAGYAYRDFTLTERLLTETRVLWDYVGGIVVPGGPKLGFYHDDFTISHGLFDPPATTLAILGWLIAVAFAWRLRTAIPGLALGLGLFLVGQALESSVFPLMLYFEHRNYLPAVGAIWAVLSILAYLTDTSRHILRNPTLVLCTSAVLWVAILAAGASVRAHVWTDHAQIIAQGLLAHPDSTHARLDSIMWALSQTPPLFAQARRDSDWLRQSPVPNTRRIGTIDRILIDCTADSIADPIMVSQIFEGPPGPYEQNLLQSYEMLSDRIGMHPCKGLSPEKMADGLSTMLDRWHATNGLSTPWRLRFRAANLYMAADRNDAAVEQAKLAYYQGSPPTNTAIMIAGVLIYCGNTIDSTRILDAVEPRVRPSDYIAHQIIADDRNKIREMESRHSTPGATQ